MFTEQMITWLVEYGMNLKAVLGLISVAHAMLFTSTHGFVWTLSCVYACTATIGTALILHQPYLKAMRRLFKRPTPRLSDYMCYRSFVIRCTIALSLSIWLAPYTNGISLILAMAYVVAFPLREETLNIINRSKRLVSQP